MSGWKPIPLPLKIVSIFIFLWAVMSIVPLVMMPEREIAFFGFLLKGAITVFIVVILDTISPLIFLYALWKRLKWGANFGMLYNGIFSLNSFVALFTFYDVFGNAIYFPMIVSLLFFSVIFWKRQYFK